MKGYVSMGSLGAVRLEVQCISNGVIGCVQCRCVSTRGRSVWRSMHLYGIVV